MNSLHSLTPEQKTQLESKFFIILRNLKKNEKIEPGVMLKQLAAILGHNYDETTYPDFIDLNNFVNAPKLDEEQGDISGTLLERKKLIQDLLTLEATSLKQQQSETHRLQRRSGTFSLGSSISTMLTHTQKQIYWLYIEFDAIDFINALLAKEEVTAHNCIFRQTISHEIRCYGTSEEVSRNMPSEKQYLQVLYLRCLLPLRISIEINTANATQVKEGNPILLKQLNPVKINILSCFVGNINFKEEYCTHSKNKDDPIFNRSAEFIKKYKSLMASDLLYEKESPILPRRQDDRCILS